ncbi:MAG: ribosome small subunit-dependent GTPase A [Phycisphaerales bacterium]|nr:ribosome small subunit-dependent GTPase A [Phycisphaerales bacterium]
MSGKRPQKKRVSFKQNRGQRQRQDDWTRRYHGDRDAIEDAAGSESIRAKGDLSRKRTILVDDADAPVVDRALWREGVVTRIEGIYCFTDAVDNSGEWKLTVRRVLRTLMIEERSAVAVGDRVWFSDQSAYHGGEQAGVIEQVEPRRTVLSRRDRRKREHVIVANADQTVIVASVAQPGLKPHLIDRYLVAASKGGMRPIVAFNKCDLIGEIDAEENPVGQSVDDVFREFASLGYTCIRTSATTGEGIDTLRAALSDHMTVFSGQSGVGKSSLINAVQPGMELATSEVSDTNEKGRHTTTHSRLLKLETGGYVVDTPGIRSFDMWAIDPGELEALFVEIAPLVAECRFRDCTHREEAGCAARAAAERGAISRRRYFSYLKMFDEV